MLPALSWLGVHWRLAIDAVDELGEASVRPTVQADVSRALTFPGAHPLLLGCVSGTKAMVAVWLCLAVVAVSVTVRPTGSGLAAVTVNAAALSPTPTVTPAGALNAPLLLAIPIGIALAAAALRLTVQ